MDRYGQVSVRTNHYSVPVRLIRRQVRVLVHACEVVIYDGRTEVARHERRVAKGGVRLGLDHYLEALLRKPTALPGATALDQARAAGRFVHSGARRLMGSSAQGARRRRGHAHADQGVAASPAHGPHTCRRRPRSSPGRGGPDRGRGRAGGPQAAADTYAEHPNTAEARPAGSLPSPVTSLAAYDALLRHPARHRPPQGRTTVPLNATGA